MAARTLRIIIIIRLINAASLVTFFQPDEFYQVLEPAWQLAFGPQSGAWLTWEWKHQLRSSLHPILFSGAYIVADAVSCVLPPGSPLRDAALIAAPRILQALIAALGDWYAWRLAKRIYGPDRDAPLFVLLLQLLSPWQWYCSTRTFSNSLETTLTVTALHYWPWHLLGPPTVKENAKPVLHDTWSLRSSLALAALAVVLRPTNILVWAAVAAATLTRLTRRGAVKAGLILLREAVICGSLVLAASALADRAYFGIWTFPPYNWLSFNISKSLAVFYGRNPWHYYLLQGLPLLCTTSLPFALPALFKPSAHDDALKALSYAVFVSIAALSLISHKEVRFIYPLLPILNLLAAPRVASFFTSSSSSSAFSNNSNTNRSNDNSGPRRLRNKPFLCAALATNLLLAAYLSLLHQPAPLSVLTFLRTQYQNHPFPGPLRSHHQLPSEQQDLFALFLTPCHSTPWRSHLILPLPARALTCEPPLHTLPNTPERETYLDEADRFYLHPVTFLREEMFPLQGALRPRYIVAFEGVSDWLDEFLTTREGKASGMTLRRVWSGFNGFFNEDWRRAGRIIVWDTGLYHEA